MISFVLPTHNRPECLNRTIDALGGLYLADAAGCSGRPESAEILVVDNASSPAASLPSVLPNGLVVRVIRRETNEAASGRNAGVEAARNDWIVMLDDDSWPMDSGLFEAVFEADPDVAAIGAEILLPSGRREEGGLPEVFIGCGVAIRRQAYLDADGYDPAFDYYAEEYDLAAKLLRAGWRVVHDCRFRVMHEKTTAGRDMNRILHHLVRNNGWVAQRYAPNGEKRRRVDELVERYARIALKEQATDGFEAGLQDLLRTLEDQPDRTLARSLWDRFTGLAQVRAHLASDGRLEPDTTAAVTASGKNEWVVRQVLAELGVRITDSQDEADCLVIGTLSPGPMLDAADRLAGETRPVVMPWRPLCMAAEERIAC